MGFSQGCSIGCLECTEENTDFEHNLCGASKEPTLPDRFRTWNLDGSILPPSGMKSDWTASHPWRAPGNAPVLDACGMAGGSSKDNSAAGGFQYRLCPKDQKLTEDCFQQTPLPFASSTQKL